MLNVNDLNYSNSNQSLVRIMYVRHGDQMEINAYQTGKKKNGMPYCINLKSCSRWQELKSVFGSNLAHGQSHVHSCYSH